MNIIDQMDAVRFTSGNANQKDKQKEDKRSKEAKEKDMPMVLRNLNNQ